MKTTDKKEEFESIAANRKARFDFFILESLEAGIELKGSEVKAIREGGINLAEGFAHIQGHQAWLEGVHINPYSHANQQSPDPVRSRKLLLHRREIDRLEAEVKQKRLTLVPLRAYLKKGIIKIEIGLAKGKKAHDKRESIKKNEADRAIARAERHR